MPIDFIRYLLAKQTVDDRALNKDVVNLLRQKLSQHPRKKPFRIIEIGAGIGTMVARLVRWGLLPPQVEYIFVEPQAAYLEYAKSWLSNWGIEHGWNSSFPSENELLMMSLTESVRCSFICANLYDYAKNIPSQADLVIAHAVLDLMPMPESLYQILDLIHPGGLAWLTLNFDGATIFQPELKLSDLQIERNSLPLPLDAYLENLYHETMHSRPEGGDSQTGRHLLHYLLQAQRDVEILATGASDWIVYPQNHAYSPEEAFFLDCILNFFEESLHEYPGLEPSLLDAWLKKRREQIKTGELIYIAHQLDVLLRRRSSTQE